MYYIAMMDIWIKPVEEPIIGVVEDFEFNFFFGLKGAWARDSDME